MTTTTGAVVSFDTPTDPESTLSGGVLTIPAGSNYYPPSYGVLRAGDVSNAYYMPVRVTTKRIAFNPPPSTNFIQYVDLGDGLSFTASQPGSNPVFYAAPDIPPGCTWNPFTGTLKGAPRRLTIGDTFTVYASDGDTVETLTVPYSVKLPTFLRAFTSPSAYTNYTRNQAIANAAVHAIDSTAYLPDPIIAFETGPYPPDVQKDYSCRVIRK